MRRSSNTANASKRLAPSEPVLTNTDSSSKDLQRSSQDPSRTLPSVPPKRPHLLAGAELSANNAASNWHATALYFPTLHSVEPQATIECHTGEQG